jgi:hypothetical protein
MGFAFGLLSHGQFGRVLVLIGRFLQRRGY